MSNVKYKVGDKVLVKSISWYNNNKDSQGCVRVPCSFVRDMARFCGWLVTIASKGTMSYRIVEDEGNYLWSDEMFEVSSEVPTYLKTKDVKDLPKDFAECAKIMGTSEEALAFIDSIADVCAKEHCKLIVCRDAYWWLAGDWTPDYKKRNKKHCIATHGDKVGVATTIGKRRKFAFPTVEMAERFGEWEEETHIPEDVMKMVDIVCDQLGIHVEETTIEHTNYFGVHIGFSKGFVLSHCTSSYEDGPSEDMTPTFMKWLGGLGFEVVGSYGDNGMDSATNWRDTFWYNDIAYMDTFVHDDQFWDWDDDEEDEY